MATVPTCPPRPDPVPWGDRQVDYWLTVYRRTWRGSVISSFVDAAASTCSRWACCSAASSSADPDQLEGATSYLAFVVPGLVASHAMQTAVGEITYPVMGMIKWQRVYYSMLATPLAVRDLVAGHLLLRALPAGHAPARCSWLVLAPFGVFVTWWGAVLAFGAQVLIGHGLRHARLRPHRADAVGGGLRRALPARGLPALPVLRAPSSRSPTSGRSLEWVARLTPLWHGVDLSRMLTLDTVDWSAGRWCTSSYLAALTVIGWVLVGVAA